MKNPIEKGIVFEEIKTMSHGNLKYPWSDMEIGDSFLEEFKGRPAKQLSNMLLNLAKAYSKRKNLGNTYKTKIEEKGVRIWLIDSYSNPVVKPEPVQVRDPYADYDARPAEKVYPPNPLLPKFK